MRRNTEINVAGLICIKHGCAGHPRPATGRSRAVWNGFFGQSKLIPSENGHDVLSRFFCAERCQLSLQRSELGELNPQIFESFPDIAHTVSDDVFTCTW